MPDTLKDPARSKLTEAEFLRVEAERAKQEISDSLQRAKAALTHNVDPRELTRRHPWIAIGSAAVAGFVAATVAIPSKEQQELNHLEKIRRAMTPPPPEQPAPTNGSAHPEKPSIGATILHELIQLLRPILLTAITASVKSGAHPSPPAPPPPAGDAQGPDKSS